MRGRELGAGEGIRCGGGMERAMFKAELSVNHLSVFKPFGILRWN